MFLSTGTEMRQSPIKADRAGFDHNPGAFEQPGFFMEGRVLRNTCPVCGSMDYEWQRLHVISDRREIIVDGVTIKLSPQPFKLMQQLIHRMPNYVHMSSIHENLYSMSSEGVTDDAPRFLVKTLRRKLKGTSLKIQSEYDLGWRLELEE